jgi:hypothetical protein
VKERQLEQIMRGLMNEKTRPEGVGAAELLATAVLIVKGAVEKPIAASRFTLSLEIGVSDTTAKRVLARLCAVGWVQKISGRGRAISNRFSVILDRLPIAEDLKRTIISAPMKDLAAQYAKVLKPYGKKPGKQRRFSEAQRQRMAFALQRLFDRHCAGDVALMYKAINVALHDSRYRAKAHTGPHALRRDFAGIVAEAKKQEQPTAAAA